MMDDDLKKLARHAPPPLEDAKRQALEAALQAYDKSGAEKAVAPKGSQAGGRLTSIATSIWSGLMKQRYMTGSALATLMILPAAAYVTWQIVQDQNVFEPKLLAPLEASRTAAPELEPELEMDKPLPLASEQELTAAAPLPEVVVSPSLKLSRQANEAAPQRSIGKPVGGLAGHRSAGKVNAHSFRDADELNPFRGGEAERSRVEGFDSNGVRSVAEYPVSTFSADVDTASYAMVRRALKQGAMPDPRTVRIEEMVNYFNYDYPAPESAETPFRATMTVTPTPWNGDTKLLHIGVKGYDVEPAARPQANLVLLVDVSGSMQEADKLPLLKSAFRLLIQKLEPEDTVAIVTYAGDAGTVLEPTPVSDKARILDALDDLRPGGTTAGAAGIEEAYRLAEKARVKGGVNRVLLATDGDFNVGPSDDDALKSLIEEKRESGVFLSIFGFGRGNYNDQLMQTMAQNGNGVAAYIDTLAEAEKTLVQEATASLFPIASDVKFQIEFNPETIAEYRQIGFETRALNREDFNNDQVDAGEIGSGHTVTAIYEITPVGSPAILNSDLRYGAETPVSDVAHGDEFAFLKIRAKVPGEAESTLTEIPVMKDAEVTNFAAVPQDVRFSIAVAAFAQKLRRIQQVNGFGFDAIEEIASDARGEDPFGYRSEFLQLVRLAKGLGR